MRIMLIDLAARDSMILYFVSTSSTTLRNSFLFEEKQFTCGYITESSLFNPTASSYEYNCQMIYFWPCFTLIHNDVLSRDLGALWYDFWGFTKKGP